MQKTYGCAVFTIAILLSTSTGAAAGVVTNETQWVTEGYGNYGYIFFDAGVARISPNIATNGSGADIEYDGSLVEEKKDPSSGNILIQETNGVGTFAVGKWYDGRLDAGFFDLISFEMKDTPNDLTVGVLVGAGGTTGGDYPSDLMLTDNTGYTNQYLAIDKPTPNRIAWYFFDVSNITESTVLTVWGTRERGGGSEKHNPVSGVVFAVPPDLTPPSYTALNPTNNATGAFPFADLTLRFDEDVEPGSGNINIRRSADNTIIETADISASNVTVSGSVVTIDQLNDFALGTNYWVEITNGVIEDAVGKPFAGITNSAMWNFTIAATADVTAPTASAFSPTNGATDIARDAALMLTFNEDVDPGTGSILIKETNGDAVFASIDISAVSVAGTNVTIAPAAPFAFDTEYYVMITNGVFRDLWRNPFAGITNPSIWRFTTLADTFPPSPDPMTFAAVPTPASTNTVTMTATAAVDDSPPVEYFFTNTISGDVSGWIVASSWSQDGLTTGVTNGYRVKARDALGNETDWSNEALAAPMDPGMIYEPFDYPAGDIDGSQAGGIGFIGVGWESTAFTDNPYDVIAPGLSFSNLPTAGGQVYRPTASTSAEMHRGISAGSQAALLADNTTLWFSLLIRDRTYSGGNENGAVLLSTGAITDPDTKPVTVAGGEAFGVALKGGNTPVANSLDLHAIVIYNGISVLSTNFIDDPITGESTTYLIAGRIDWAVNGSNDTLRLFNIADSYDVEPGDGKAVAMVAADLDQSLFDTIAIGNAQISSVDEIRFAKTYFEVMGSRGRASPTGVLLIVR